MALDDRFEGDNEIDRMSVAELRRALRKVHRVLYAQGKNTEWDSETVEWVAVSLFEEGLGPTDDYKEAT